ncbi:MAG: hypothetical protein FJW39_27220 [Acidobacteria bacterium]|nr:hypothetical protein [Acidobacteriota bacterium]
MGTVERRRKARKPKAQPVQVKLSIQVRTGVVQIVPAKVVDLHEDGCGVETSTELAAGQPVVLIGDLAQSGAEQQVQARVAWSARRGEAWRAGLQFAEAQEFRAQPPKWPAHEFPDHYEVLQLSPNADPDTVSRVYRMLAQRYHPDNQETGNDQRFRQILDAYRVLSDPEKRAGYDADYQALRKLKWRVFDQPGTAHGIEAEKAKRRAVMSALYAKRLNAPEQPAVSILELEDLLGIPKEHLEFSLWYLKENGLVTKGDSARYAITVKGVDAAELPAPGQLRPDRLLEQAS